MTYGFLFLALFSFWDFGVLPIGVGVVPLLVWVAVNARINIRTAIFVIVIVFSQVVVTVLYECSDNLLKNIFVTCTCLLLMTVIFQQSTVRYASFQNYVHVNQLLSVCSFVIFTSLCVDMLQTNFTVRPSGMFFHEPSHVNFVLVPLFIYSVLERRNISAILNAISLVLAFSSSGLVALAVSFSILNYRRFIEFLKFKFTKKMLYAIPILIAFLAFSFNNDMLIDRIVGLFGAQSDVKDRNLSSIVYLNGYLQAIGYLRETFGFGVGFSNMGCEGGITTLFSDVIIDLANGRYLNYNDGSFLFSKLISELGIFGFCFVIYLFKQMFKEVGHHFRLSLPDNLSHLHNFALAFYIPSVVFIFLRGAGFFDFSFMTLIFVLPIFVYIRRLLVS